MKRETGEYVTQTVTGERYQFNLPGLWCSADEIHSTYPSLPDNEKVMDWLRAG